MIEKIIIGIILGIALAVGSLQTNPESEGSLNILGVILLFSLLFIGSSFAYGAVYGLMAFGEIFIGYIIGSIILGDKKEELAISDQDQREQSDQMPQKINLVEKNSEHQESEFEKLARHYLSAESSSTKGMVIHFNSFAEAQAYAKKHPKQIITRNPEGLGFIAYDEFYASNQEP